MRWLRSWPAVVPAGRAHVDDELPRLVLADYDYTPLGQVDDDVLLLEWDMHLDPQGMTRFAAHAAAEPGRVHVAPYLLAAHRATPTWAHRRLAGSPAGEHECDLFGFGATYLPRHLVERFLAAPAPERGRDPRLPPEAPYHDVRFTDQTFSIWHAFRGGAPRPRLWWDVRPDHLHR